MARISGVDLPRRKHIAYALPYVFGIGPKSARDICEKAGIPLDKKVDELSENEVKSIRDAIEAGGYRVEGDLRRDIQQNIKRLMDLGCYRGLRHRKGLPVERAAHPHQRPHA